MKWKSILRGFVAVCTLCASMTVMQVQAEDVERWSSGYFVYGEGQEGDTPGRYYIVGYKGNFVANVSVPEEIGDKTIEFIDGQAFMGCRRIQTVTLPETIECIYTDAFKDCTGLKSVTVPSARLIDTEVFSNCVSLEKITLPENLEAIGDRAFENCAKLETITLPAKVNSLGEQVFLGCSNLAEIKVSEENTYFQTADGVLYDKAMTKMLFCPQKKTGSITIPASVTDVSEVLGGDFVNDKIEPLTGITDIYVEEGNTSFSSVDGVLYNKNKTRLIYCPPGKEGKITIPSTVTEIGNYTGYPNSNGKYWLRSAFYGCEKLTEIEVAEGNTVFASREGVLYSQDFKTMHYLPEAKTGTLTIPSALWYMEEAFGSLENGFNQRGDNCLTNIVVEEGNAYFSVQDGILYGNDMKNLCLCPRYKTGDVVIPDTVKTIEAEAFEDCTGITSVTMKGTTPWIESGAFKGCSGLKSITLPAAVSDISSSTFEGCTNLETIVAEGVKVIYGYAFKDCKFLENVTFSEELKSIRSGAFLNCQYLESFAMNENLKTIAAHAFEGCTKLGEIHIPGSVTSIAECAFKDCTGLKNVTIAEGVEEVRTGAFQNCTQIKRITLPSTTGYVMGAFLSCLNLSEVTINSTDCMMHYLGALFHECNSEFILRVAEGSTAEVFAKGWYYNYKYIIDPDELPVKNDIDLTEGDVVIYEENYYVQNGVAYAYTDALTVTGGTAEEPTDNTIYSRAAAAKMVLSNLHILTSKKALWAENDLELEIKDTNTIIAKVSSIYGTYGGGTVCADNMKLTGDGTLNIQAGTLENADPTLDAVYLNGCLEINGTDNLWLNVSSVDKKSYECMSVYEDFNLINGNVKIEGGREGLYVAEDAIVNGGNLRISAWEYGIDALDRAIINNGTVEMDIYKAPDSDPAIRAAIMANENVEINGGDVYLHSDQKNVSGIHVDEDENVLLVSGGKLKSIMTGEDSYGLYSNGKIELSDGTVEVAAVRGIVGGYDGFCISGGNISVNAELGIVHYGSDIYISGGDILVDGTGVMEIGTKIYVMPETGKRIDVIYGTGKESNLQKTFTDEDGGRLYFDEETLQYMKVHESVKASADPDTPAVPENPTDPNTPSTPENPIDPNTPSAPENPINPDIPANPDAPQNPAKEDDAVKNIASDLGVTEETAGKIADLKNELDIPMEVILTTDASVKSQNSEDLKGAEFKTLCANAYKYTKNSISLKWKKVKKADGYILYGNRCNSKGKKYKYKYIKTFSAKKTSFTHKKLKKGTYYKYVILAYKLVDGKKVTIASSKTMHAITKGGKYGVAKSLKLNKKKLTMKAGEKYRLKAKEVKRDKTIRKHRKIAFESDNPKVATVNKNGKVKAVKKGKCNIYVYAQNGIYKKVKVTVK